jgi:hypothetical protein
MTRRILAPFAALAVSAFAFAGVAAADDWSPSAGMERMQDWAADHQALLDARLAGLKAGLKLTADQDPLWAPFEAAVRDDANLRMNQMKLSMERMQQMREMMQGMKESEDLKEMAAQGQAVSPVDRLAAVGQRLSERGAAITKVAEAAKPLYASLDDSQKRRFVMLGREMLMMGHGHPGMDMMRGGMGMMRGGMGMMGEGPGMTGGMGRMGGKPGGMESMGNGRDEEENNSDEE